MEAFLYKLVLVGTRLPPALLYATRGAIETGIARVQRNRDPFKSGSSHIFDYTNSVVGGPIMLLFGAAVLSITNVRVWPVTVPSAPWIALATGIALITLGLTRVVRQLSQQKLYARYLSGDDDPAYRALALYARWPGWYEVARLTVQKLPAVPFEWAIGALLAVPLCLYLVFVAVVLTPVFLFSILALAVAFPVFGVVNLLDRVTAGAIGQNRGRPLRALVFWLAVADVAITLPEFI